MVWTYIIIKDNAEESEAKRSDFGEIDEKDS